MTTAKNPEAKNEAKDFVFAFPKPDDWKNIVHDLKLTKIQERELEITVRHVLADIERYRAVERKSPPRDKLVAALKRLEKALRRLQYEIDSTANHMEYFLPHDTMEYIGWSLTFSAIGEALGTDVFPKNFDLQLQRMSSKGGPITLPSLEDLSQPMRRALGLKHGHVILAHFIDQVYAPLKKWVSLNKLNKGGRPAENIFRSFIIRRLAERSSLIVGRCATTTPKGKFAELCIAVLPACGWSSDGIEKAIEAVLGKMKGKKRKEKKAKESKRKKKRATGIMKNAYLIPVSAFKIEDLSGSDLAVLAAIHVAWLNLVRCRRPPSTLHPIDVLRGDRDSWLRGRLRPRSAHPADGVGHWHWKATFPTTWPSGIRNLTPSPASSEMTSMTFSLAPDGANPAYGDLSPLHRAFHLSSHAWGQNYKLENSASLSHLQYPANESMSKIAE